MGKSIYFTDDELVELEGALEAHGSSDLETQNVIKKAFFKVALALDRPFALAAKEDGETKTA